MPRRRSGGATTMGGGAPRKRCTRCRWRTSTASMRGSSPRRRYCGGRRALRLLRQSPRADDARQRGRSRYPGHGKELADGRDDIVKYMRAMHAEAMGIFRGLTEDDLNAKCVTPGVAEITVWKWMRLMVEHEIHHRGQIYLYLGLLDVPTPPLYGLTEEQVRERSL